jgi:hypothetical protein
MQTKEIDGFLAEYNALRQEIVTNVLRRTSVQNIGTSIFVGMQTVAMYFKIPELSIVSTYLFFAFWRDDAKWVDSIICIGQYIRNVLEPRVYGLQWETILMHIPSVNVLGWEDSNVYYHDIQ